MAWGFLKRRAQPRQRSPLELPHLSCRFEYTTRVGGEVKDEVRLDAVAEAAEKVLKAGERFGWKVAVTVTGDPDTAGAVAAAAFRLIRRRAKNLRLVTVDAADLHGQYTLNQLYHAFCAQPPLAYGGDIRRYVLYVTNTHLLRNPDNVLLTPHSESDLAVQVIAQRRAFLSETSVPAPLPGVKGSGNYWGRFTSARRVTGRIPVITLLLLFVTTPLLCFLGYSIISEVVVASMFLLVIPFIMMIPSSIFLIWLDVVGDIPRTVVSITTPFLKPVFTDPVTGRQIADPERFFKKAAHLTALPGLAAPAPDVLALYEQCTERLDWYSTIVSDPAEVLLATPALVDPTYGILDEVWETTAAFHNRYGTLFPTLDVALGSIDEYAALASKTVDVLQKAETEARRIGFAPPAVETVTSPESASAVAALADAHRRVAEARARVAKASAEVARLSGLAFSPNTPEALSAQNFAAQAHSRLKEAEKAQGNAVADLLGLGVAHVQTVKRAHLAAAPLAQLLAAT